MKTVFPRRQDVDRRWHLIDASEKPLGRIATEAATVLRGKHRPSFSPHEDLGDHVVIINAASLTLTGNKLRDKFYYTHTGRPGSLKTRSAGQVMQKDPAELVAIAVRGMLPKNALGRRIAKKLRVYPHASHPHPVQFVNQPAAVAAKDSAA